jgi:hypothetical protein
MSHVIADYQNGNVHVTLHADGTKVREYEGTPAPVHPESIDLKITNWCDAGCAFCHENSTVKGKHADLETIRGMIADLPAGVELAIGGGDPLSHPSIFTILQDVAHKGLIGNVTVNGQHIYRHFDVIQMFRECGILHGLGISFSNGMERDYEDTGYHYGELGRFREITDIVDENTIFHFIAGEHDPNEALNILRVHPKILVLGYKNFGRGISHYSPRVNHLLGAWRYWIGTMMRRGIVCFDNLALEQLNVRKQIPSDLWDNYYMGDDGSFTMYADAVKGEYAVTSTSVERTPYTGQTATTFFRSMHRA